MNMKSIYSIGLLALLAGGCQNTKPNDPVTILTDQHSPIRMRVYDWPVMTSTQRAQLMEPVLLLPPLGIEDAEIRNRFHEEIYGAALRRYVSPIQTIHSESEYAPYIRSENLVRGDGSLDTGEIAFIGALMNCKYVIVPYVRELRPYHPQRADLRILVISSGGSKVCAEFSSMLDAADRDVMDYFMQHSENNKKTNENTEDLFFKIKSPAAFQGFVADTCATVMADKLSL